MRSNLHQAATDRDWPLTPPAVSRAYAELKSLRILVINDDDGVRQFLQLLLEGDGHIVLTTDRGARGLELAALRPDLIICDMKMPGLDGFAVVRAIRQNAFTRDIPFIFLTGSVDTDERQRGVTLGADDCVGMPFKKADLNTAITAACHKHDLMKLRLRISAGLGQPEPSAPLALFDQEATRLAAG